MPGCFPRNKGYRRLSLRKRLPSSQSGRRNSGPSPVNPSARHRYSGPAESPRWLENINRLSAWSAVTLTAKVPVSFSNFTEVRKEADARFTSPINSHERASVASVRVITHRTWWWCSVPRSATGPPCCDRPSLSHFTLALSRSRRVRYRVRTSL